MKDIAYIALGSNMGERADHLARGRAGIVALADSRVIGESSIEETKPLGAIAQNDYLNQMIALETTLSPHELLTGLQQIEVAAGRVRDQRWGPRTLDLDIVCFEHQSVDDATLRVPHVELPHRDFWQRELAELRGPRA